MDLDAIKVFVKVVEAGSFSAAARALNMPNTTVSAKVAALEKRLGVSLLHRTTRTLRVTDTGQRYYEHCAVAMREIELGEAALLSERDRPSGLLRLTAPVDIGHTVLPRITRAFLEQYPDVSVELILSNRVLDIVGQGIDLAVRAGELKDSTLVVRRFLKMSMRLLASPAYLKAHGTPAHPRDLASHRFVSYTGTKSLQLTRKSASIDVPMHTRFVVDDMAAIKAMLVLDEGIGMLPDFLAADALASGALVPVLEEWSLGMAGAISFVYPSRKYASPAVRAYIETALNIAKNTA
jgi:DNA-binding transcriptional LysR family regulator